MYLYLHVYDIKKRYLAATVLFFFLVHVLLLLIYKGRETELKVGRQEPSFKIWWGVDYDNSNNSDKCTGLSIFKYMGWEGVHSELKIKMKQL